MNKLRFYFRDIVNDWLTELIFKKLWGLASLASSCRWKHIEAIQIVFQLPSTGTWPFYYPCYSKQSHAAAFHQASIHQGYWKLPGVRRKFDRYSCLGWIRINGGLLHAFIPVELQLYAFSYGISLFPQFCSIFSAYPSRFFIFFFRESGNHRDINWQGNFILLIYSYDAFPQTPVLGKILHNTGVFLD